MAPKYHHTPLSGGDRKALKKELSKSRAMTRIFAERSAEKRRVGEALIREADNLACQSWNEKIWSDGGPIDPSPTIDQAVNGGFPRLQIECSRCKTPRDVDLCALRRPPTTFVHDLVGAVGLSEVQERRQTPSGHAAPACTAPAASGGGQEMWSRLLLLVTLVVSAVWSISLGYAFCPERPPCHGCGCKGGPGYRSPDGHCVGFKALDKVCGNPPSRCVFENAPGTGENRECALAPRQPVKKTPD